MYVDITYPNISGDNILFSIEIDEQLSLLYSIGELWELSSTRTDIVENYLATSFLITDEVYMGDPVTYYLSPTDYLTSDMVNLNVPSWTVYTKKRVKPVLHYFLIDTSIITDIADAIREKAGVTTNITPNLFVNYLENL